MNPREGEVWLVEAGCWANRKAALRLAEGWSHVNGVNVDGDGIVTPVRPLVVIDPEQIPVAKGGLTPTWLRNLAADLRRDELSVSTSLENVLLFLADRIEAVVDPKPDEPGTWGVVEASCVHSDERRKWVRHEDDNWWPAEKYSHAEVMVQKGRDPRLPDGWDDLVDPVLVREGMAS